MKRCVSLIHLVVLFTVLAGPAAVFAQNPELHAKLVKLSDQELAGITAHGVLQQTLLPESSAVILWDEISRTKAPSTNTLSTQGFSQQASWGSMMVR